LDSYYSGVLSKFYSENPLIEDEPFNVHRQALMDMMFGTADFHSTNLRLLGDEAEEIIANDDKLQLKWVRENGVKVFHYGGIIDKIAHRLGINWRYKIVEEQIKRIKPDVLYVQELNIFTNVFLKYLKRYVRLLVGQVACLVSPRRDFSAYDLMISSLPHYVDRFREKGIDSEYLLLAFEQRILEHLAGNDESYNVSFVGGYSKAHQEGSELFEDLCSNTKVDFWGYGVKNLLETSPILSNYHGQAWGMDMYNILHNSKISLNRHISCAKDYANNMRLFEATGAGSCLLTDLKSNLGHIFDIDKEVIAYKNKDELLEKTRYLLSHDEERNAIAKAGQKRTLAEHTYKHRMEELVEILRRYM